jgi:hypothetical protein
MPSGKVFGIGLSRTGTRTLAAALNLLGIRAKWYPSDPRTYHELIGGQFKLTILEEYDALTDTPVVPYYPQFDKLYPGSKFVLTVRDKESWLRSAEKHWTEFQFRGAESVNAPFWRHFGCFIDCCVYGCHAFNSERFSYVYDTHLRNVQEYFRDRPEALLTMNICAGDGWNVLCPFLGQAVPDVPFPNMTTFNSPLLR